ncbi:MAG: hypothetical protein WD512_12165 [Candidatus Paceibacterota bacterium]
MEPHCSELFCPLSNSLNTNVSQFNDVFNEIIFSFMIVTFSIFLSACIVTTLSPIGSNNYESEDEESEEDEAYEYKYSDFFEQSTEKEQLLLTTDEKLKMKKNVITETTPNGNIIMSYYFNEKDPELSAFHYYCNDRSIPYKYLDTVARKFVITYNCTELYLYLKTELLKGIEKIKQSEAKEQESIDAGVNNGVDSEKTNVDSVFATFKKYKQEEPKTKKAKLRSLIVGKNRYTRLGNVEDYEKSLLPKNDNEIKPISFAEYKKKVLSSN